MATIQVREIPEDLYEVLRHRARRAGQSMQAYMRAQLVALAERPTKQEAVVKGLASLRALGWVRATGRSITILNRRAMVVRAREG